MSQYIKDKQAEVRQAAVYGAGILGQYGGDQFAQTCAQILPLLMEVIMASDSRNPENVNSTENAISAVAKILKFNSSAIQKADEILDFW
jgi:hypothetical protein